MASRRRSARPIGRRQSPPVPRAILHAPWRIEYILGPRDQGCFLCQAARAPEGDEAAWKRALLVYRNPHALVLLNRYPYTGGHLMVAPRRHTADLPGLSEAEGESLWRLSLLSVKVLRDVLKPHGYNLGANLGRAGGAGLEAHLHFHVLPRWVGDTNFLPVIGRTNALPVALNALWKQLRPAFRASAPRST